MRKMICDICGDEIPEGELRAIDVKWSDWEKKKPACVYRLVISPVRLTPENYCKKG